MISSPVVPKWPILVPFCRLDHWKSKILLIFDNFSFRGCQGSPMLLFWIFIDKTQMSRSPECTATFFKTWRSILVGHLRLQSVTYRVDTPCMLIIIHKSFFHQAPLPVYNSVRKKRVECCWLLWQKTSPSFHHRNVWEDHPEKKKVCPMTLYVS